ncbi:MAG: galactokinase [Saprospiraceae bacterium]|nr:galactokinase [Saprospiraceae bacterium]
MKHIKNKIETIFFQKFGTHEIMIFAPGRANIIGEHTDYNNGFVLPFAISQGVFLFASKNNTNIFNIYAADTNEFTSFNLDAAYIFNYGWEKYFHQSLLALNVNGFAGINLVFGGNLPIGAGISSSSAITSGFIVLLNALFNLGMDAATMVDKASEAEVGSGVRGGIMDQFTIINSVQNNAILLDCRDNSFQYIELHLEDNNFFLINTNVKHSLVHTDYNNRRAECEKAVGLISRDYKNIGSLRDLSLSDLPSISLFLEDKLFNRVSFVVEENNRVLLAVKALKENQYTKLGALLNESHDGLSHKYDVSCEELDWLVKYTLDYEIILGSRMMGGGFGGCTINLIKGYPDKNWIAKLNNDYFERFGLYPTIIPIQSSNGILNFK